VCVCVCVWHCLESDSDSEQWMDGVFRTETCSSLLKSILIQI